MGRAYGAATFEEEKRIALEKAHCLKAASQQMTWPRLFEEFCRDLKDSSLELRDDFEVALEQIDLYASWVLEYASERLRGDKEVVLKAVRADPFALKFADDCLRGDRDVVLEAVTKEGLSLQYASKELRGDKDVVLAAIHQSMTLDAEDRKPKKHKGCMQDLMFDTVLETPFAWNAQASYKEADEKLKDEIPWDDFEIVAKTCLATTGEMAPVMTVALLRAAPELCDFEVFMLSGTTFTCSLPMAQATGLRGLTVNDLATKIVELLPKHTQVKHADRVFIVFLGEEQPVSPWDSGRALDDFVMQSRADFQQ